MKDAMCWWVREADIDGFRCDYTDGVPESFWSEAITALIRALREHSYIERDIEAVNEMRNYQMINGRYEARPGKHDDILMTRAIGLLVMDDISANGQEKTADKSMAVNPWIVQHMKPNR